MNSMSKRHLIPWLVTERDFLRYISRALRACKAGRAELFYHRFHKKRPPVLFVLTRYPVPHGILDTAYTFFLRGRVTKVRLENLPPMQ